jgi:ADP-heptose:LPS heptosyltransferase
VNTVLALRALGLGDFITGLPALRALRRTFPEARLMLAAPAAIEPLAELSGTVDELIPAEPLESINVDPPDLVVNLHGRGPKSHCVALGTRPGRLIAFAHADVPESRGMPRWIADEHEVDRWCRLLEESGIPADPSRLDLPQPAAPAPAGVEGATLIHPGASAAARRWPAQQWVEVARAEHAAHHAVAITAGPGEGTLARAIASEAGLHEGSVISGDLLQLAAAVAAARVVVCGDTGVAHLATALGTPSCVLFGPTAPAFWGPPPWHPHVSLWSGRRGDPHGTEADQGLMAISAQQVIDALATLETWRAG